jgi:molybdenum cofactor sulfurtransferase
MCRDQVSTAVFGYQIDNRTEARADVVCTGLAERMEDGTVSFMAIAALQFGFQQLQKLGMDNISQHTHSLAQLAHEQLSALRHASSDIVGEESDGKKADGEGQQVIEFYGFNRESTLHGSVLNFNLLRPTAVATSARVYVGYREVEKIAAIHGIHL